MLLVDEHPLVHQGLGRVLSREPDLRLVATARSIEDATRHGPDAVDVAVIGASAGGADTVAAPGRDALRRVRRRWPSVSVLVLTAPATHAGRAAVQAGADGHLPRDTSPQLLVAALRSLARGERYLPDIGPVPDRGGSPTNDHVEVALTERETQVLAALADGASVREIAEELGLSPQTVSTYKGRVHRKLGRDSLADLVRYADERGVGRAP